MKKLNNKGFTLIEIVIVIVIIAILAAMLVPSLTQWISNSKEKSFIEGANAIKTATLSQLSTNYAENNGFTISGSDKAEVQKLAGDGVKIADITVTDNPVKSKPGDDADNKTFNVQVSVDSDAHTIGNLVVSGLDFYATWNGSNWKVESYS